MESMFYWEICGKLARWHRPGRWKYENQLVPQDAVDQWIDVVREKGIRSIICLLNEEQLRLYEDALPEGLVAYYRNAGFEVAHIPTVDYERVAESTLADTRSAYQQLPKPVLVHCSAGEIRSRTVVEYILGMFEGDSAS